MDKLFNLKIELTLYQSKDKKHFSTMTREYDYMPFEGALVAEYILDQIALQMLLHPGQPFAILYDVKDKPYLTFPKEQTLTIIP